MKGLQIVLGRHDGRAAAALLRDGRPDDLLIDGRDAVPGPGAILRGIVDRPAKGQGGVFVRLPGRTGFLRGAKGRRPGEAITVQVTGYAEPGKAVPLSDRLSLRSRHVLATPGAPGINVARSIRDEAARDRLLLLAHEEAVPEGVGLILRTAAEGAAEDAVLDDLRATLAAATAVAGDDGRAPALLLDAPDAHEAAWRDWPEAPVSRDWEALVADGLAALRRPEMRLREAVLFVEPTRALVAVDVNTPDGAPGGLKANLACARELTRQLRLRGLGGQVVVDCAPMPKGERRTVEGAFKAAAKADPVDTSVIGWTPLGHLELTRKRERRPLEEVL